MVENYFKAGDRVRIKKNAPDAYSITAPGSEGVISSMVHGDQCSIVFYKMTGKKTKGSCKTWNIETKYMEKIDIRVDDDGNLI